MKADSNDVNLYTSLHWRSLDDVKLHSTPPTHLFVWFLVTGKKFVQKYKIHHKLGQETFTTSSSVSNFLRMAAQHDAYALSIMYEGWF